MSQGFVRLTGENGRSILINLSLVTDIREANGWEYGSILYQSFFAPNGDQFFIQVLEPLVIVERKIRETLAGLPTESDEVEQPNNE